MASLQSGSMSPYITLFDYKAACETPGWRDTVAWPLSHGETFRVTQAATRAALAFIDRLDEDPLRSAALLGLGKVLALSVSLVENAFVLQAAAERGVQLRGGPPELATLRGEERIERSLDLNDPVLFKPMAAPRGIAMRRLVRTASWTPYWRLPLAMLSPEIVAVSHNVMLRDAARRNGATVKFFHAESLLHAARRQNTVTSKSPTGNANEFAAALAIRLTEIEGLAPVYRERLADLIEPLARLALLKAITDVEAMRRLKKLPQNIWSGSGGYYPARAVGIEVRRRGGHVTRFAHGWLAGMAGVTEGIEFTELAVSDRFVVETPVGAENLISAHGRGTMAKNSRVEIIGHRGKSVLDELALDRPPRSNMRPHVIYASTILRGQRQFFPPILPDVIYLDWQFRLAEAVQNMPVDLLCKPHPEGLLRGQRHPLADIAPTSIQPFESHIAWADRFLFDYGQSTTFAEALCTDRPIIFIDMGNPIFSETVKAMIDRRCRVIRAGFDARNRPQVDPDELKTALCEGADHADPEEFRALLMGGAG